MILQLYFDLAQEKKKNPALRPDLSKLRTVLFWDTAIEQIDWEKHKQAVIERVFERGNEEENQEIVRFYGEETLHSFVK